MEYVFIAKTKKYGEVYFKKKSHEICQMKEKHNFRGNKSDGSNYTPPFFLAVLIISVISPWLWTLLPDIGASHPFLFFTVAFILLLIVFKYFGNKIINKKLSEPKKLDIQTLEYSEQQNLLREIKIASMILYSNINRFLDVLLLLAFFSFCVGLFYKYPSNLHLVYLGINELAVYLYIVSFTSRRRREKIFRQIEDSVCVNRDNAD